VNRIEHQKARTPSHVKFLNKVPDTLSLVQSETLIHVECVYEIKISTSMKKENKHNNLDYSWAQQMKQIPANNLLQFSI